MVDGLTDYRDRFLAEPTTEELVVQCLRDAAAQEGHRVKARVNAWRYIGRRLRQESPDTVLKAYGHPLQPDVDLLVETGEYDRTLSIHEIKMIRWNEKRPQPMAPTGRLYAGFGQALALTMFGADYCYLWHVWVHPSGKYRVIAERDIHSADRLENGWVEFFTAYAGLVKGILFSNSALPIGYVVVLLITDVATNEVLITPFPDAWRAADRLPKTRTGMKVRELLMKALA